MRERKNARQTFNFLMPACLIVCNCSYSFSLQLLFKQDIAWLYQCKLILTIAVFGCFTMKWVLWPNAPIIGGWAVLFTPRKYIFLFLHPKDVDRRHPFPLVDHLQEQTHQELQHRTDYLMRVWELLVLKSDVRLLLVWSLYLEHCVDDDMLPVLVNQAVGKVTPHLASFGSALKKKSYISGSSPILTGWTQGFQRARPLCWCRWRQGRGWSGWWWCLRWRREEATWRWPAHGQ